MLQQAHQGNQQRAVTGALVYGNGQFMQVLEGEQAVVAALYEHIAQDPRHKGVFKLADKAIAERSFSSWSMAFKVLSPAQFARLVGYRSPAQLAQQLAQQLPAARVADAILLNMMRELLVPGAAQ